MIISKMKRQLNSNHGKLFSDDLLGQIRERFAHVESDPFTGKRIYFENIGGSLTLKSVVEVVAALTALPDNAGRKNPASQEIDSIIARGLEDVKNFMGARSGVIALSESTTSNVYKTLTPIILNVPGNNVVVTDLEHPSIYDATKILADRYGKQWRSAKILRTKAIIDIESLLDCIDSQTIVLAIIHGSNNTATKNDVKEIIRQARKIKPDLYVVVDGSQSAPHTLIDVEDFACDVYLASSYKTFGKAGASPVFLSDRASLLPHDKLAGKPENYWELGTREPAGYASWSAVIDYLCWLGSQSTRSQDRRELICAAMKEIEQHECALTHRMLKGTRDIRGILDINGVTVVGEVEDLTIKDPAFLINVEGMNSAELVSALDSHSIVVTNRTSDAYSRHTLHALGIEEGVRVSACHYNSPQEVDAFLKALLEIALTG